jgi:hypothetical protein
MELRTRTHHPVSVWDYINRQARRSMNGRTDQSGVCVWVLSHQSTQSVVMVQDWLHHPTRAFQTGNDECIPNDPMVIPMVLPVPVLYPFTTTSTNGTPVP